MLQDPNENPQAAPSRRLGFLLLHGLPPGIAALIPGPGESIHLVDRLHALIDQVLRPAVRIEETRLAGVEADVAVQRREDFLELDRAPCRGAADAVRSAD